MRSLWKSSLVTLLLSLPFGVIVAAPGAAAESTIKSTINGTGVVVGTVSAPKLFTAAHVYLRGQDKPVTFMVFTAGGKYQAINVLPGTYRITAERRGFAAVPQTITVKAGETVTADLTMNDGPDVAADVNGPATVTGYPGPGPITGDVAFVSDYDKLYPPGPGRVVLERTCMACHGNNFYGLRQYDHAGWEAVVDMMSKRVEGMDTRVPPGKLSPKDRLILIDYMAANFGLDKKKRALHVTVDIPVDEAVLGKAMLIEYDLPKANVANAKPRGQNPYFDDLGNVWSTDRGFPNGVVKLDPRTATFEQFLMPNQGVPHGITIDAKGAVWIGETVGFSLTRLDPDSGKFERFPIDPRGFIKGRGHDPIVDKDQNVWLATIVGNQLTKYDRKTGKIVNYEPPAPNSYPYGLDKDKDGNCILDKMNQLRAKLDDHDGKAVVFTSQNEMIVPYISEWFDTWNISHVVYPGKAVSPKAKQALIDEFRENPDVKVFLSTDAGQDSIDLPEASLTINYDLPWTDATKKQRVNRQDRIDSEMDEVSEVTLQYLGTVEDRKEEILAIKRSYSDQVFGGQIADETEQIRMGHYIYLLTGRDVEGIL